MKRVKREEMVVMAACQQTKFPFGITARKEGKDYVFYWAFKLSSSTAKREGFEKNKVRGSVCNAVEYPGCPHCGGDTWFQCGRCGKIVCMRSGQEIVRCPACGNEAGLEYGENFDLSGGDL